MNQTESLNLLRQMPVFGGLNDATLLFLIERSDEVTIAADDFFFREGDPAKSLFVIRSGQVQVEKHWQGSEVPIGRYGEGDCLGEMAIIDLQARSASVRAETDCQSIEIARSALSQLYKHDLEQYAIIMMNMGREVSRRLRTATERLFAIEHTVTGE